MPATRGDKLTMIKSMDKISDLAEQLSEHLLIERPKIPKDVHEDFKELMNIIVEAITTLKECIYQMFENKEKVLELSHKVEELEEKADDIEHRIIEKVFQKRRMKSIDLILIRDLAMGISRLANFAEQSTDFAVIMVSKKIG